VYINCGLRLVIELLPNACKALSSIPSTHTQKKKLKRGEERREERKERRKEGKGEGREGGRERRRKEILKNI
jgi:hypothetical protein